MSCENRIEADPELQHALATEALAGLDQLLTAQPAGETIACSRVGAIVRLIEQARHAGESGAGESGTFAGLEGSTA